MHLERDLILLDYDGDPLILLFVFGCLHHSCEAFDQDGLHPFSSGGCRALLPDHRDRCLRQLPHRRDHCALFRKLQE